VLIKLNLVLVFQPTSEMLTAAYEFFWTHLKRKCFKSLVKYCKWSRVRRKTLEMKIFDAKKYVVVP